MEGVHSSCAERKPRQVFYYEHMETLSPLSAESLHKQLDAGKSDRFEYIDWKFVRSGELIYVDASHVSHDRICGKARLVNQPIDDAGFFSMRNILSAPQIFIYGDSSTLEVGRDVKQRQATINLVLIMLRELAQEGVMLSLQ
jgi:hypothetical protein